MIEKVCAVPEIWNIYVPLPNNPLKNLNCRVIKSGDQAMVIDTGFRHPDCEKAICDGLSELGLSISDTKLFLTHLHSDHTGLVGLFADAGCTIYMNETEHNYLHDVRSWGNISERFLMYGFTEDEVEAQFSRNPAIVYAPQGRFEVQPVQHGTTVTVGDVSLLCIETPGHTPGHTCLYIQEQQIMLLGDHVLFDITPNITAWPQVDNSLKNYLDSLELINSYPMKIALAAHRKSDMDVYQRIAEIQEHHKARLQNTVDIITQHPNLTPYEIASHMTWSMRGKHWGEFPVQQKYFAVGETVAHLDYLEAEGVIAKKMDGQTICYLLA